MSSDVLVRIPSGVTYKRFLCSNISILPHQMKPISYLDVTKVITKWNRHINDQILQQLELIYSLPYMPNIPSGLECLTNWFYIGLATYKGYTLDLSNVMGQTNMGANEWADIVALVEEWTSSKWVKFHIKRPKKEEYGIWEVVVKPATYYTRREAIDKIAWLKKQKIRLPKYDWYQLRNKNTISANDEAIELMNLAINKLRAVGKA